MSAEDLASRCKDIASLIRMLKNNLRTFHRVASDIGYNAHSAMEFLGNVKSIWGKIKLLLTGVSRVTMKFNIHYVDHRPEVVYPYQSGVRFVHDDFFGSLGRLVRFIEKNLNWILKLVVGIGSVASGITSFAGGLKAGAKFFAKFSSEAPRAMANVSGGIKQAQLLINNMKSGE